MDGAGSDTGALQVAIATVAWAGIAVHGATVFRRWLREAHHSPPTGRGTMDEKERFQLISNPVHPKLVELDELLAQVRWNDLRKLIYFLEEFAPALAHQLQRMFVLIDELLKDKLT